MYLLQGLQGVSVHFCDVIGFRHSIVILTNGVNIHQAVVCHLNTLEVREKPTNKRMNMLHLEMNSSKTHSNSVRAR